MCSFLFCVFFGFLRVFWAGKEECEYVVLGRPKELFFLKHGLI